MTLLALDRVGRRYGRGPHERIVLYDVTLELDGGELVAIWGMRRSGRSTLLRIAAGIEQPDTGVVRFQEQALGSRGGALGQGIGYCTAAIRRGEGRVVLDDLLLGLLAQGGSHSEAKRRARGVLDRVGASSCSGRHVVELDAAEAIRVSLARALMLDPLLLVVDEPTEGVELLERDRILLLLRSLADEGIGILMTVGESTALTGADRALAISKGELRGSVTPQLAPITELDVRRLARG